MKNISQCVSLIKYSNISEYLNFMLTYGIMTPGNDRNICWKTVQWVLIMWNYLKKMETNIVSSVRPNVIMILILVLVFLFWNVFPCGLLSLWVVAILYQFLDNLFILGQQYSANATFLKFNFSEVSGLYKINVKSNPYKDQIF